MQAPRTPLWFAVAAVAIVVLALLGRRRFPFMAPVSVWLLAAAVSFVDRRLVGFSVSVYGPEARVPIDGVVPRAWRDAVVGEHGRVERIPYELCVLVALRDALRRREVYVEGANRWRNPEDDPWAPQSFLRRPPADRSNTRGELRHRTARSRPRAVLLTVGRSCWPRARRLGFGSRPQGGSMRRPALVVLLTAAALASPAAANAAGAPTFRDRIDDSYPIENFCDSGVTVQAHERTIAVGWETDTTFKLSFNSRTTFSYGDQSVSDHWAGRVFSFVTEGESFESPHTELVTENGLRAYLRAPGGGTVTRDAGNLQYLLTFGEGGEFLGVEVIKDAGGHPAFYEPVWCNAALELLGIPAS